MYVEVQMVVVVVVVVALVLAVLAVVLVLVLLLVTSSKWGETTKRSGQGRLAAVTVRRYMMQCVVLRGDELWLSRWACSIQ